MERNPLEHEDYCGCCGEIFDKKKLQYVVSCGEYYCKDCHPQFFTSGLKNVVVSGLAIQVDINGNGDPRQQIQDILEMVNLNCSRHSETPINICGIYDIKDSDIEEVHDE